MASAQLGAVIRCVRNLVAAQHAKDQTDRDLLSAFLAHNDQAAFTALVKRHGPLVLGVCRRVLHHFQDAEDAFQATFLLLARKAASIRKKESLSSWLHGAAYRMAMHARRAAARRRKHEEQVSRMPPQSSAGDVAWREVQAILDEEIGRLPELYRQPFILCCLENKSRAEVGRLLGVKEATVWSRLAHARKLLHQRLGRRGVSLSALLGALSLSENTAQTAVSGSLASATVKAALAFGAGKAPAAGVISAQVAALVEKGIKTMFVTQGKIATVLLLAVSLLGVGWAVGQRPNEEGKQATKSQEANPGGPQGIASFGTAKAEPTRPAEVPNAQQAKRPANKPAQPRVIVQPRDSLPRPDQEPDCIFMPSPPKIVDEMLKLACVQQGEVLFDLGSGDGRICIAAAKRYRARAFGYEIQADLVKESLENVKNNKLEHLVTIERRNIFKLDLSGADVVTLWLLPVLNIKLIPQLEKLKPGSRIVSFDFDMGNIVKPDKVIEVEMTPEHWFDSRKRAIYLWKTPLNKDEKLFRELFPRLAHIGK